MTTVKDGTKQKVIDSAISLFNVQGYSGTSVRMICERANVNAALISYYFGSKKGLLEYLMITFFEGYLQALEQGAIIEGKEDVRASLLGSIEHVLYYQQEHHDVARFVHREITLDTMLVRELMSTYLMKEKHIFYEILEKGMERKKFTNQPIDFIIIQIRGMMTLPFLHPQYIREVHHLLPHDRYFIESYIQYVSVWIDNYLCDPKIPTLK
ncbi:forespore capture DNA-binding protein RefZ [Bacillus alkalicellulosilyticus]|uniref:forespore capture DNA-binding protein RefZ n=1 Tax=Alkalihalobacterium alkalicellulosilyticum TaxID=1912214 RepID=UPI000997ACF8|nr:forespore capture DNA-binding protein RefZ [Bacillus alkalicellulosilyticus]